MAPLRLGDTADVFELALTATAICGLPIDPKGRNGATMRREAVRAGIAAIGEWLRPLCRLLGKIKPVGGKLRWLCPHVKNERVIDSERGSARG